MRFVNIHGKRHIQECSLQMCILQEINHHFHLDQLIHIKKMLWKEFSLRELKDHLLHKKFILLGPCFQCGLPQFQNVWLDLNTMRIPQTMLEGVIDSPPLYCPSWLKEHLYMQIAPKTQKQNQELVVLNVLHTLAFKLGTNTCKHCYKSMSQEEGRT